MKEKSDWFGDAKKSFWIAVLTNSLILLAFFIIFRPVYETNDDMSLSLFVNGSHGLYDAHFIYSNYILGCILAGLYRICGSISWFAVVQYAVLFSAFTAVMYVTMRRLGNPASFWLSILAICFFAYDGYIRIQFTKTAGIATAAGVYLLFYALEAKKRRRALLVGYLLVCIGFLYRNQQSLIVFALMSGIGVFWLLENIWKRKGILRQLMLRCGAVFAGAALLIGALHIADQSAYRSPEWKRYFEYNELLTELMDYGFPDYTGNKDVYHELGLNQLAYRMYSSWNYVDTEKFTPEVMRKLIEQKPPKKVNLDLIKNFLRDVPKGLFSRFCFYCFLLILVCWLLWGIHTRTSVVALLYEILALGAVYFYLYYLGRYLYNRVDVGLWITAVLFLLWTFRPGKIDFSDRTGAAVFLLTLCLTQYMWKGTWRFDTAPKAQTRQPMREVLSDIYNDQDHFYLVKSGAISYAESYDAFETLPYGFSQNVLLLGGWPTLTPWYFEQLESCGIENPYRDMIGNEKVYLVDTDIKSTLKYLRRFYDASAKAKRVAKYQDCSVYQILSGDGT